MQTEDACSGTADFLTMRERTGAFAAAPYLFAARMRERVAAAVGEGVRILDFTH